jgi:multidrug efflux system membrane fusion protein
MMNKRSWKSSFGAGVVVLAGAAALYFAYTAWSPQSQRTTARMRGGEGPVPVLVAAATTADVPVYIDGVGTTKALNTVTVRSQVDGKLISVNFREGQDVPKGYVLARIDPVTYQAQYDQAVAKKAQDEAQLANARLDLERYRKLAETSAGSRQQADTQAATVAQLEAQVKLDQASIESAKAYLDYTTIVAPLAGRTGIRQVDEGNIVHASDTTGIVVLTQLQPIAVVFSVPQQRLPEINRAFARGALPVEAMGADGKAVVDRGTLTVIDNQIDPSTGTVKLKAEFPNTDLQQWPGQFINVRLRIDTLKDVIVVPTAAVQRGASGTFVYVVAPSGDTVAVRPVVVTQQDETRAVIASGLQASERVVTTGFARLADGSRIVIGSGGPTPAAPNGTRPRDGESDVQSQQQRRRSQEQRRSETPRGIASASPSAGPSAGPSASP